jgi:hypothetical protein
MERDYGFSDLNEAMFSEDYLVYLMVDGGF